MDGKIKARWKKIMSFAGAWEGDPETMTIKDLMEMRKHSWNREGVMKPIEEMTCDEVNREIAERLEFRLMGPFTKDANAELPVDRVWYWTFTEINKASLIWEAKLSSPYTPYNNTTYVALGATLAEARARVWLAWKRGQDHVV